MGKVVRKALALSSFLQYKWRLKYKNILNFVHHWKFLSVIFFQTCLTTIVKAASTAIKSAGWSTSATDAMSPHSTDSAIPDRASADNPMSPVISLAFFHN